MQSAERWEDAGSAMCWKVQSSKSEVQRPPTADRSVNRRNAVGGERRAELVPLFEL
jgi:hypothetical protein